MMDTKKKIIEITKKRSIEFGLVTILIATFLAIYLKESYFVIAAFFLALITIIIPSILSPFAALWFGLSKILGAVTSMVLLTIVFFVIVIPVGLARRFMKKDSLKIDQFKKSTTSVMVDRDHLYTSEDLLDTF